ncbi:MAG: ferritin [Bacteroidales bacterium]|nr:ferritin [Bacteroidales bacterium]
MINNNIESVLNKQIQKEEFSSRLYLSMAMWCEVNGFPGASSFLYRHAEEERLHQLKIIHYVNDRGGKALLLDQEEPASEFSSLQDLFEQILVHEEYITGHINQIYGLAVEEKDYTTGNFLQWFISEQLEEEKLVKNILDKIKLVGNDKTGMFHIDKELATIATAKPESPVA